MGPLLRFGALAAVGAAVTASVAGCGGSVADTDAPDPTRRTTSPSSTPFCTAAQANLEAIRPLNGLVAQGQVPRNQLDPTVAAVRQAGSDMVFTAPDEIRVDVERTVRALEMQLDTLQANGGDAAALTGDAELNARLNSPEFAGAGERVRAYVERTCVAGSSTATRR